MEDINAFVFHTVLALSAPTGHLPLEGKVAIQKYRFPHPTSAPLGHPLPLDGAAERRVGGLAFFFCGEAATTTLNPLDL